MIVYTCYNKRYTIFYLYEYQQEIAITNYVSNYATIKILSHFISIYLLLRLI